MLGKSGDALDGLSLLPTHCCVALLGCWSHVCPLELPHVPRASGSGHREPPKVGVLSRQLHLYRGELSHWPKGLWAARGRPKLPHLLVPCPPASSPAPGAHPEGGYLPSHPLERLRACSVPFPVTGLRETYQDGQGLKNAPNLCTLPTGEGVQALLRVWPPLTPSRAKRSLLPSHTAARLSSAKETSLPSLAKTTLKLRSSYGLHANDGIHSPWPVPPPLLPERWG